MLCGGGGWRHCERRRSNPVGLVRWPLADLIDAPSVTEGGGVGDGVNAGGYTAVSYTEGAGNGLTITPNKGDTSKRLFFSNAGDRRNTDGGVRYYGEQGYYFSSELNSSESLAWFLIFHIGRTFGSITNNSKLNAQPIRCVRS